MDKDAAKAVLEVIASEWEELYSSHGHPTIYTSEKAKGRRWPSPPLVVKGDIGDRGEELLSAMYGKSSDDQAVSIWKDLIKWYRAGVTSSILLGILRSEGVEFKVVEQSLPQAVMAQYLAYNSHGRELVVSKGGLTLKTRDGNELKLTGKGASLNQTHRSQRSVQVLHLDRWIYNYRGWHKKGGPKLAAICEWMDTKYPDMKADTELIAACANSLDLSNVLISPFDVELYPTPGRSAPLLPPPHKALTLVESSKTSPGLELSKLLVPVYMKAREFQKLFGNPYRCIPKTYSHKIKTRYRKALLGKWPELDLKNPPTVKPDVSNFSNALAFFGIKG